MANAVSPVRTLVAGLFLAAVVVPAAGGELAGRTDADGVSLINDRISLRTFLVQGPSLLRAEDGLKLQHGGTVVAFDPASPDAHVKGTSRRRIPSFSQQPPADWTMPDADVSHWPRYLQADLSDFLGAYGVPIAGRDWPSLLCLRTNFGIADPARATGDHGVDVLAVAGEVVEVGEQGEEVFDRTG